MCAEMNENPPAPIRNLNVLYSCVSMEIVCCAAHVPIDTSSASSAVLEPEQRFVHAFHSFCP